MSATQTEKRQPGRTQGARPRRGARWHGVLSRAKTALIWLVAGGLILLAVLVTVLRLALPLASEYREQVARELGQLLNHRVEVGAMDTRWRLLGPRVHLDQVAIYGEDAHEPLLRVERLDLGVRLWHSLWQRQLRFHSVRVLGADVHTLRDAEGRFSVSGAGAVADAEAVPAGEGGGRLLEMLAGTTFRLESSRLRYTDQVLGLDYRFDDINLAVAVASDALRLAGQVYLPPELGRGLTVGVDLRGDPESLETWRGQVYVHGQGIVIDALPDDSLARRVNAQAGVVDVEMWSRIAAGRPDRVRARVQAADVRLGVPGAQDGEPTRLDSLAADGLWEAQGPRDWQIRLHQLRVQYPGQPATSMGISLSYLHGEAGRRVWGEAEDVRLEPLWPLVLTQDLLEEEHRVLLSGLAPAGAVPRVRFHGWFPEAGEMAFAADGAVRELGVSPHEDIPGAAGLTGRFSAYRGGGMVELDSHDLRFVAPRLFAGPLDASLNGTVQWTRTADGYRLTGERLRLRNDDIRATARLNLDLGEAPGMDLQVDFADGVGSRVAHYLPVGIMPENTSRWLSRSIVDGRVVDGRLVFRGPLRKFPLEDEGSEFEVRARVVDGVLDYQEGWPAIREVSGELVFDDRGMRVENASGRVYDARIGPTRVRIADFRAAELEVEGQATGTLSDMLRYVRESPLAGGLNELLDDTRAEGDSRLDLSLHMPLHRRGGGPAAARVSGALELEGNRLRLLGHPVDFRQVNGRVAFTESTVNAEGVRARFNGENLVLNARRREGEPLGVRAEGMQPVAALGDHLPAYLAARLEGRTRVTGELTVPMDTPGHAVLRLDSMLEGVASTLPEPLAKAAEARVPLRVDVPLGRTAAPIRIRYSAILSAALRPEGDDLRGELRFNDGDAMLPEVGLRLAGRLDRVDLDAWRALTDAHAPQPGEPPPGGRISNLDLRIGEAVMGRHVLRTAHVSGIRDRERWQVWMDAPALRGELSIPRDLTGSVPLSFNIERVDLDLMRAPDTNGDAEESPRLNPRDLPALRGAVRELVHDSRRYTDLRIEATRMRDGLQVHHLQAATAGGHGQIRITGDWRESGGRQQTQLRFDLGTTHLGRMLTDLGFQHGFDRGEGKIDGQLRWPDAPTHFTWDGLEGSGRLEVKNGRLVEVDPGAGRLLGLFSLNMLPRRLALDFRDVFQRGFAFDSLDGTVRLAGSDVYTPDLRIRGAAATVEIEGRTGIVARDHDQRIVVTPRVGTTLPVAGALLGGPVAGAAVFILDRVLGMGRGIDEAARVEYRVTGSWDEPVVEVQARAADDDNGDSGR